MLAVERDGLVLVRKDGGELPGVPLGHEGGDLFALGGSEGGFDGEGEVGGDF